MHGCDPNWGRIVAAAGNSDVNFHLEDVSLWIGSFQLMQSGMPLNFSSALVSHYMKEVIQGVYPHTDRLSIRLVVGPGNYDGIAWGCDLSKEYVTINADYTT